MSGLFRRLSSRRSVGPDGVEPPAQAEPGTADAPTTAPTEPGARESLLADPAGQTRLLPEPAPAAPVVHPLVEAPPEPPPLAVSDLPAGLDPDELAAAPLPSARRSRLRRRVSFLRAAREVLLRDLGGFIYEIHRTAADIEHEAHRRLRELKLARLTRLDTELHALELQLDDVRRHVVVREPGVGGECPNCGELFGSDAHYCAHCGMPLTDSARKALAREAVAPPPEEYAAPDTEFHWPRRGEPATPGDAATTGEPTSRGEAAAAGESQAVAGAPGSAGDEPAAPEREPATRGSEAAAGESDAAAADPKTAGDEPVAREPEAAAGEAPEGGDEAPAVDMEPAAPDARETPARDGEAVRNGREESVYGPVERRT